MQGYNTKLTPIAENMQRTHFYTAQENEKYLRTKGSGMPLQFDDDI